MRASVVSPPVPTDAEVTALVGLSSKLGEGEILTHGAIADAIGAGYGSTRYRTVVARWRKRELNIHNRDYRAQPGTGYVLLPPTRRVDHGRSERGSGVRKLRKATRIVAGTDTARLSPDKLAEHAHEMRLTGAMLGMMNSVRVAAMAEARARAIGQAVR